VLERDGSLQLFINEIDGLALPATNFANLDREGRTWISVSTTAIDREKSFKKSVADGFIALVDHSGARIVADGIGFTNENKVDPSGRWLYVHETMGRSLLRFPIKANGDLGPRETVTDYGPGIYPDGFEFDCEGGIWCTSVLSNRIIRLDSDGVQQLIIDAGDSDLVERAESAYQNDTFCRSMIDEGLHSPLGNCASVCFGGNDLKTVYIGNLHLDRLACFRSPVAGAPPPHWLF
jgi:sugar lactone lactonase YvrE